MIQENKSQEWFASWFNSPYYHVLYDNRDENEAEAFLTKLLSHLNVSLQDKMLDLCCGAGRHTRAIAKLGFSNVAGCDLSKNSIETALSKKCKNSHFFVHDMRDQLPEKYNVILNLFTSFGYFETIEDNHSVLNSIYNGLEEKGIVVIDYMNAHKAILELKPREEVQKHGVQFNIQRTVNNGRIIKTIAFQSDGESYIFQEKVQALLLEDFKPLLEKNNLRLISTFGNYDLNPFELETSNRLILICEKS
jgi:ubiquinone/menaquinone biosynthesis C-methylase UbiE